MLDSEGTIGENFAVLLVQSRQESRHLISFRSCGQGCESVPRTSSGFLMNIEAKKQELVEVSRSRAKTLHPES